jgi:hypothetical protein
MCAWPSSSTRTKNWGTEVLTDADQEAQLDLLHTYNNDQLNATTGHAHTGGTNDGPKITLTTGVQGVLPVANGGTAVATLALGAAAYGALLYPVGSLYMNDAVSTNPGTLLGFGTWTAITDRIIIGVGSTYTPAQATGGSATVTIGLTNLPSPGGSFTRYDGNGSGSTGVQGTTNGASGTSQNVTGGSGTALNVMNPYYAAYIWRRSA